MQIIKQQQANISKNKPPKLLTEKQSALIFWTLKSAYGSKFMAAFKSEAEIKSAQAVCSKYCGFLTDEEIQRGLDKSILASDWNPNVAEFLRLALDFPNENLAVARVLSGNCTDQVSKLIRRIIGSWDVGHQSQQNITARVRGLYSDTYTLVLEERMRGVKHDK